MEGRIPLRSLVVGEWKYRFQEAENVQSYGELYISEDCSRLQLDVWEEGETVEQTDRKSAPLGTFQCTNIAAVDLRLTSKFSGDLDSMVAKLTIETERPICFRRENKSGDLSPLAVGFLVKMSCDIDHVSLLRDILKDIRYMKYKSSLEGDASRQDIQRERVEAIAWREGLPGWVSFLPCWMYSRNLRFAIERLIIVYTILSVAWAVWQLYIHVSIIKAALQPVVELLNMYLESIVLFLDHVLHRWTDLWLYYCQPLVVIWASFIGPVWKTLRLVSRPLMRATKPIIESLQRLPWRNVVQLWIPIRQFLAVLLAPLGKVFAVLRRFQVSLTGFDPMALRLRMARQLLLTGVKTVGQGTSSLAERAYRKKFETKQLQKTVCPMVSSSSRDETLKTD
ncbi:uncharacterized protein LOC134195714 [Corticium candelabrum]|uniref:uncharacterized protein LOC134195714 n=1 Tax=Corticium candelabrum TaxID=121492 RepID=UPI002E26B4C5|nr:uncharacterized protein LOC134195714 [Corticium candelabrum]